MRATKTTALFGASQRALTLILCLLLTPLDLHAEGKRALADRSFREGYGHYARRDYTAALAKFLQARALYPSYKIDLNIGYTLDALKRRAEAAGYYQRFLATAGTDARPKIVGAVKRRLQELARSLARVTVDCPVRGAVVSVDGHEVGRTPLEHALYLDPGDHTLRVARAGQALFQRTLSMVNGGHTILSIPLRLESRRSPAAPVITPLAPAPRPRPFYKKWWFWTAVGAVVAGAVVGGVVASQTGGSDWVPVGDSGSIRLF